MRVHVERQDEGAISVAYSGTVGSLMMAPWVIDDQVSVSRGEGSFCMAALKLMLLRKMSKAVWLI